MTKYSKEYRGSALALSDEIEVKKAAEQLGMNLLTLKYWAESVAKRARKKKTKRQSVKQKLRL